MAKCASTMDFCSENMKIFSKKGEVWKKIKNFEKTY